MTSIPKWTDDRTATLESIVGTESPVSVETVEKAAADLGTTTRSIGSKLRKMGYDVAKKGQAEKAYSEAEETTLLSMVEGHPDHSVDVATIVGAFGGKFTVPQIRGKLLSMDLVHKLKPAEPKVAVRTYTKEEEDKIISMAANGAFIEDIAEALGKEVKSIRGKCLSMLRERADEISSIPETKVKVEKVDPFTALGDEIKNLTVAEIAEKVNKSERGVKQTLTHRGLTCADYDGFKKRAAADEKAAKAA